MNLAPPEDAFWLLAAKSLGAIAGSAISLAYVLPKGRREAALRFFCGVASGMVFGTSAGLKLAEYLELSGELSRFEIAMSGAAAASLSTWWALGILSRLAARNGRTAI